MSISVYFISSSEVKTHSKSAIFAKVSFEGKYAQTCFLPESCEFFVGLTLAKIKTFDPFYKTDFFHLGAIVGGVLSKSKIVEICVKLTQNQEEIWQKNSSKRFLNSKKLSDFSLGLLQKLWKFDKYKTNLTDKTKESSEKQSSQFDLKNENRNAETSQENIAENSQNEKEKSLEKDSKTQMKITFCPELKAILSEFDAQKTNSLNLGMSLNRHVVEETPEFFNPKTAVEIVQKELGNYENLSIKTYSYDWLLANGFGGVCAVGRASENKPNLVHTILTF